MNLNFTKQIKNISQRTFQENRETEMICNVIGFDNTGKPLVDLIGEGFPVNSLITVTSGDRVRLKIKNKNNMVIISKA